MELRSIFVKGAKENNLKDIDVEIPKYKLVVFTGLSGCGKTTLAFDTIYKEGQRRYVESLSSYARQFLGNVAKPDVESISGLSPAISIDQKSKTHNPRSTVGTVTEIYDYLRLLFARVGVPYCPRHHEPIISFAPGKMADIAMSYPPGTRLQILAPIVRDEKGTQKDVIKKIRSEGFVRVRVDKKLMAVEEVPELEKNKRHSVDIVVDRIIVKEGARSRVLEAIELGLDFSKGYIILLTEDGEKLLSSHHSCKYCGFSVPKLEPRLFSFNAPLGCCPACKGLGIKREAAPELLIPDTSLSLNQGAVRFYKYLADSSNLEVQDFRILLDTYHIDRDIPYKDLTERDRKIILFGSDRPISRTLVSLNGNRLHRRDFIEGVKTKVERLYASTQSEMMRDIYGVYMRDSPCTVCHGARLSEAALSVKVNGLNIYEVTELTIEKLIRYIDEVPSTLSKSEEEVVHLVLREISSRARFLADVGLSYLTLSRMSLTLSGGEAQRIRLATQIGSKLSGILYVLDEPSIGLHQRDCEKLIRTLKGMVELGNTLIVVEHDEEMIRAADYIVDIGPGAGVHGGEIVATGSVEDIMDEPRSITGQYLLNKLTIDVPKKRRPGNGKFITLIGAECNNLKKIDVPFPLGKFIAVTGVSGSGKSSLVTETLYPAIRNGLEKSDRRVTGKFKALLGLENVDKVVAVTQEPIGRTPRSNPATYVGVFDDIRALFAQTVEARARGYNKGRFSFNLAGGRCEKCQGGGVTRIPMNFLPDVYVKCDQCGGRRYNEETLEITYKGKNIYEVLEMTVEEALSFFANRPKIRRQLQVLFDVGLGYIKLGQQATTLSGGEAQRVKLAYELQRKSTGKTLYILDEPTTGLHRDDVKRLIAVLQRIVDHGDTVIIIEHNLDIIKVSDHVIDLGPEGGDKGGRLIASGTPEEVAKVKRSYTGQYLKRILAPARR